MKISSEVARHKTAISRPDLSRPIKFALSDEILTQDTPVFDYGCGRGDDLMRLQALGFKASGWDPVHRSDAPLISSPVVNLGYVVNVIEDRRERQETLKRACSLSEKVLIVSARLELEAKGIGETAAFGDGYLTSLGTFQKFFDQQELKNWIDQTLDTSSLPAGPGVFYVFRREEDRTSFLASQYRRRSITPRLVYSAELFSQHEELLRPLMDLVSARGRIPADEEVVNAAEIKNVFGSLKRAFWVCEKVTGKAQWEEIAESHAQDLLIYLALSRFDRRPIFSHLPRDLQLDVKGFFPSYSAACKKADELLFSIGNQASLDKACSTSEIGKVTPPAFYIHESGLEHLSPVLRLFEGCARGYIGRVSEANLIKLHRQEPKVSYLGYPDFETDPHPALAFSLTVHFQTFRVKFQDYRSNRNPPILHRKETFLHPSHPLYEKFSRLTRIEEKKNLYENPSLIGTRDGWEKVLAEKKLYFRGHRLFTKKE